MLMKPNRAIRVPVYAVLVLIGAVSGLAAAARNTAVPTASVSARTAKSGIPVANAVRRTAGAAGPVLSAAKWTAAEGDVDPKVLSLALTAAATAIDRGDVVNPRTLTIIDFSKPSTTQRLWVYDLRTRALLYRELVAHGRGNGTTYATRFSNESESNKSSLGLFVTAEPYIGKNGYSLRLDGLEPGINDRARQRAIVIHGAPYVNATAAKAQGFLGRSWGCPALRPAITRELIDAIKDGNLLFAYYPDQTWLSSSPYLKDTRVVSRT